MNIRFIKIAKYGSGVPVCSKYQFYCQSTMRLIDPDIDLPISYQYTHRRESFGLVYASPMKRSMSSAKYLGERVIALDQLAEIIFDLGSLLTSDEYLIYGSKLVRERFANAFIRDELIESRKQIISRAHYLIKYLSKKNEDEAVCVSHSFFMKVVEAEYRGSDLLRHPELIEQFIVPNDKTYQFGDGFIINVQSMRGDL